MKNPREFMLDAFVNWIQPKDPPPLDPEAKKVEEIIDKFSSELLRLQGHAEPPGRFDIKTLLDEQEGAEALVNRAAKAWEKIIGKSSISAAEKGVLREQVEQKKAELRGSFFERISALLWW